VKSCFGRWGLLDPSSELLVKVARGKCEKGVVNHKRSTYSLATFLGGFFGFSFLYEFGRHVGYK
jgi:hypothetical protein